MQTLGVCSSRNTLDAQPKATEAAIEQLLSRSGDLELELAQFLQLRAIGASPRVTAARQMYDISFGHGAGVLLLIAAGNVASAMSLVRVEYEALVRAYWLLHAAPDSVMEQLRQDLSLDAGERLPMIADMLKALTHRAPHGVLQSLLDFRDKTIRPLNSFVHSGGHAYQRNIVGYPNPLVRQILVASNGLKWSCAFEACNLASDANGVSRLYGIRTQYMDCLPENGV